MAAKNAQFAGSKRERDEEGIWTSLQMAPAMGGYFAANGELYSRNLAADPPSKVGNDVTEWSMRWAPEIPMKTMLQAQAQ